MSNTTLLHFDISHYNEKVRWALDYKRWPHRRVSLIPGFHVPRVRWASGQNLVPVLIIGREVLTDSTHILEQLERRRPEPALFPEGDAARAQAREIEAYFDDEVAPELRRLFWAAYLRDPHATARMATNGFGRAAYVAFRLALPFAKRAFSGNLGLSGEQLARARARLPHHLDHLERLVRPSGYLVGERFSVADLTAASILSALLRPPEFPYALPEPWPEELLELRESVARRAASQWALSIYAGHRGISAEVDRRPAG